MPQELVSFLVGQGGNQVGREFWKQLCIEHLLDSSGSSQLSPYLNSLLPYASKLIDFRDVYFSSTLTQDNIERYYPRAILIDTEPNVLNKGLSQHFCRDLFKYQNMYVHPDNTSAGNNWFLGYDLLSNQQVFNDIFELTQKELENCDSLGGFQFMHSLSGGTGSGGGSALLELLLHDYYPKKSILAMSIFDDLHSSTVSTGPYNTILTLSRLIEYCQGVIPIDNSYFYNIFPQILSRVNNNNNHTLGNQSLHHQQQQRSQFASNSTNNASLSSSTSPLSYSQEDINYCIAQMLAQVTIPFRFQNNSSSSFTLQQLITELSPHPRCHFFTSNILPIPHRLSNLPSFNKNISHKNNINNQLPNVDFDAVKQAGIVLPPSYLDKYNLEKGIQPHTQFIPWLQTQHEYNINTINNTTPNPSSSSSFSPSFYHVPTFTSPPPVSLHHLSLVEAYTTLLHPEHRSIVGIDGSPAGKFLSLSFFHSYNQQLLSTPTMSQYQYAKQALNSKFDLNFIENIDPQTASTTMATTTSKTVNTTNNNIPSFSTNSRFFPIHSFSPPTISLLTQMLPNNDIDSITSTSTSTSSRSTPLVSTTTTTTAINSSRIDPHRHQQQHQQQQPLYNFDSLVLLSNNTNIRHYLSNVTHTFTQLYNRGAWVSQYCDKSVYFNPTKVKSTSKTGSVSIGNHQTTAHQEMERSLNIVADVCQDYHYLETSYSTDQYYSFTKSLQHINNDNSSHDNLNDDYHHDNPFGPIQHANHYLHTLKQTVQQNQPPLRSRTTLLNITTPPTLSTSTTITPTLAPSTVNSIRHHNNLQQSSLPKQHHQHSHPHPEPLSPTYNEDDIEIDLVPGEFASPSQHHQFYQHDQYDHQHQLPQHNSANQYSNHTTFSFQIPVKSSPVHDFPTITSSSTTYDNQQFHPHQQQYSTHDNNYDLNNNHYQTVDQEKEEEEGEEEVDTVHNYQQQQFPQTKIPNRSSVHKNTTPLHHLNRPAFHFDQDEDLL